MTALNQAFSSIGWGTLPTKIQMQVIPAFFDMDNGQIYLSRLNDGSLAPMHVYDSLPNEVLMRRELNVVSGFLFNGQFLTNEQTFERLSDKRTTN